ncbi:cupin domain-containing protein [Roseomonas hellenica]|uniref:Cupin domain-containing protein n=1 Tax=Plastoroseomonas hellenica TaxID=2687306 RepID=A0ABS5F8Y1_9PROT|nr:cupin domain-containing protein [Plastoroseomonas hellenica]MBR0669007.1 cupin domain-containing protein [Plastoroseomonas hellenica]
MIDMADLPVQLPAAPASPAAARARFFNSGNAFNIKLPPVPAADFAAVLAAAAAPDAPTGLFACDQSGAMGCAFPATTPLMLARYARIREGDALALALHATGLIAYVLRGAGAIAGPEGFAWGAGDVVLLPGDRPVTLRAATDALLWIVTNEPMLALDGARPGPAAVAPVHYPAAEIERQLALLATTTTNPDTSGLALIFSSDTLEAGRNIAPTLTLSLNTLPPGEAQPPHRHNSAAITLALRGEDCHSLVAGQRCPWTVGSTLVTPPGEPHSHHNGGGVGARFLIVQDGGLHYHARTMGFVFLGQQTG